MARRADQGSATRCQTIHPCNNCCRINAELAVKIGDTAVVTDFAAGFPHAIVPARCRVKCQYCAATPTLHAVDTSTTYSLDRTKSTRQNQTDIGRDAACRRYDRQGIVNGRKTQARPANAGNALLFRERALSQVAPPAGRVYRHPISRFEDLASPKGVRRATVTCGDRIWLR